MWRGSLRSTRCRCWAACRTRSCPMSWRTIWARTGLERALAEVGGEGREVFAVDDAVVVEVGEAPVAGVAFARSEGRREDEEVDPVHTAVAVDVAGQEGGPGDDELGYLAVEGVRRAGEVAAAQPHDHHAGERGGRRVADLHFALRAGERRLHVLAVDVQLRVGQVEPGAEIVEVDADRGGRGDVRRV